MMLIGSRDEARRYFLAVRRKVTSGQPLEPLETLLAQVLAAHSEYHALLDDPPAALEFETAARPGAVNPFLHLGLHVAVIEQLQTDRPPGILALYRQLVVQQAGDVHGAEHRIMDCLATALASAVGAGGMPDEAAYMDCIRSHLR